MRSVSLKVWQFMISLLRGSVDSHRSLLSPCGAPRFVLPRVCSDFRVLRPSQRKIELVGLDFPPQCAVPVKYKDADLEEIIKIMHLS
jgi:hypothetical protein